MMQTDVKHALLTTSSSNIFITTVVGRVRIKQVIYQLSGTSPSFTLTDSAAGSPTQNIVFQANTLTSAAASPTAGTVVVNLPGEGILCNYGVGASVLSGTANMIAVVYG
jgi:hypothetical protein